MIQILDGNHDVVCNYFYDAWGAIRLITDANGNNITYSTNQYSVAYLNPIRYRGYYYDVETGFYYLQTRYYDPEIGRFISRDSYENLGVNNDVGSYNLFAYCSNNPLKYDDSEGTWPKLSQVFAAVTGVAMVVTATSVAIATAPILAAAISVGYTASVVVAGGTLACATVSAVCGGSMAVEAVSGYNPIKDLVGQESYEGLTFFSTAGMYSGYSSISSPSAPVEKNTITSQSHDTFLPESFYSKKAPKLYTPYGTYTNCSYNFFTHKYEQSTAYYDVGGRQFMRIDWTDHGYLNHGNPHVHFSVYSAMYPQGKAFKRLD